MKFALIPLVAVPVLFLVGYVYWYGDPTAGYRCRAAATEKFSQIVLNNSRSFQADLDMFVGQEGKGREIIAASDAFKKFVSYLAEGTCSCVVKKINSSNSTPRELLLQECVEEVRSNPPSFPERN
jgi:hypothetical protein